jgi:hypothetical protein
MLESFMNRKRRMRKLLSIITKMRDFCVTELWNYGSIRSAEREEEENYLNEARLKLSSGEA